MARVPRLRCPRANWWPVRKWMVWSSWDAILQYASEGDARFVIRPTNWDPVKSKRKKEKNSLSECFNFGHLPFFLISDLWFSSLKPDVGPISFFNQPLGEWILTKCNRWFRQCFIFMRLSIKWNRKANPTWNLLLRFIASWSWRRFTHFFVGFGFD